MKWEPNVEDLLDLHYLRETNEKERSDFLEAINVITSRWNSNEADRSKPLLGEEIDGCWLKTRRFGRAQLVILEIPPHGLVLVGEVINRKWTPFVLDGFKSPWRRRQLEVQDLGAVHAYTPRKVH